MIQSNQNAVKKSPGRRPAAMGYSHRIPRRLRRCVQRIAGHHRHRMARGATLLALVRDIQSHVENDADVVRIIRWMVNTGAIRLTGTFAGHTV